MPLPGMPHAASSADAAWLHIAAARVAAAKAPMSPRRRRHPRDAEAGSSDVPRSGGGGEGGGGGGELCGMATRDDGEALLSTPIMGSG